MHGLCHIEANGKVAQQGMFKESVRVWLLEVTKQAAVDSVFEGTNRFVEVVHGSIRVEESLIVCANMCSKAVLDFAKQAVDLESFKNNASLLVDVTNKTHAVAKPHGNSVKGFRIAIKVPVERVVGHSLLHVWTCEPVKGWFGPLEFSGVKTGLVVPSVDLSVGEFGEDVDRSRRGHGCVGGYNGSRWSTRVVVAE